MKGIVRGTVVTTVTMWCGFVAAQTSPAEASGPAGPVIAVSPGHLDFGLVGVGRTKQLGFTVQNVGSGTLTGVATVAAPFALSGNAYSLEKGQSQTISVHYRPTAEGSNRAAVRFSAGSSVTVSLAGRARLPPKPPGKVRIVSQPSSRFAEEEEADVVIRYFSDTTSFILKPAKMDGAYRSICDRKQALAVAGQQPRHRLAVVVLIHYGAAATEEPVKQKWTDELTALGYERVVFLRGTRKLQINGLEVLDGPRGTTVSAGK